MFITRMNLDSGRRKNFMPQTKNEAHIKRFADEIKGIKTVMFTTIGTDGFLRSRPMIAQKQEFDGNLWYFCHLNDDKVREIQNDNKVCVSFSSPSDEIWVTIAGTAEIVVDKDIMKKMWTPELKKWFSHELHDDNIALIKVKAHKGEYWETNKGVMVNLVEIFVEVSRDTLYQVPEHNKVDLD
jgi:general stress protein 26